MAPDVPPWQHDHTFGQDHRRPGERRTFIVIALTAAMMGIEIAAGVAYGSMALLADGLHMASHAVALGVSALAYVYARRHARDGRYSFGTGKINTLGGYSGAVLLAVFALLMAGESTGRLFRPIAIVFDQALLVAVLGLLVNGLSVFILGVERQRTPTDQTHEHADHDHDAHDHSHAHEDHNLRSAYLHVLADALTSLLAIVALLAAKYRAWMWMDPAMGLVGAALVARWSLGLLRSTSHILLDRQGPETVRRLVTERIEADGTSRVADLHLWSIGPGLHALVMTIVTSEPATPDDYRARLPQNAGLEHVSIEVQRLAASRVTSPAAP